LLDFYNEGLGGFVAARLGLFGISNHAICNDDYDVQLKRTIFKDTLTFKTKYDNKRAWKFSTIFPIRIRRLDEPRTFDLAEEYD
jgi:hypothetical protein